MPSYYTWQYLPWSSAYPGPTRYASFTLPPGKYAISVCSVFYPASYESSVNVSISGATEVFAQQRHSAGVARGAYCDFSETTTVSISVTYCSGGGCYVFKLD